MTDSKSRILFPKALSTKAKRRRALWAIAASELEVFRDGGGLFELSEELSDAAVDVMSKELDELVELMQQRAAPDPRTPTLRSAAAEATREVNKLAKAVQGATSK